MQLTPLQGGSYLLTVLGSGALEQLAEPVIEKWMFSAVCCEVSERCMTVISHDTVKQDGIGIMAVRVILIVCVRANGKTACPIPLKRRLALFVAVIQQHVFHHLFQHVCVYARQRAACVKARFLTSKLARVTPSYPILARVSPKGPQT
eukprot:584525-Pelagomonas_calceolata.AAC.1